MQRAARRTLAAGGDQNNNGRFDIGDTVTFTITVSNSGPDQATGVAIRDALPVGYGNITLISDSGVLSSGVINWTGLTIASGAAKSLNRKGALEASWGKRLRNFDGEFRKPFDFGFDDIARNNGTDTFG